jgi:putative nucleotidyltransferase with HDIG domain
MPGSTPQHTGDLKLSEVIAALSCALDLVEGHPLGHAGRTCLLALRLAAELRLPSTERAVLFHATLLKDAGCLTTTARLNAVFAAEDAALQHTRSLFEWSGTLASVRRSLRRVAGHGHSLTRGVCRATRNLSGAGVARNLVRTRCMRGAEIGRMLGLPEMAAGAISSLDEHWNGGGMPAGLRGQEIPFLARVIGLAQTVESLVNAHGVAAAQRLTQGRRGSWFDPGLVDALGPLWKERSFWQELGACDVQARLAAVEPDAPSLTADEPHFDFIAEAFATAIDAKSPYTYRHSEAVAALAVGIGERLEFSPIELRDLRRAALLHDIGKLRVSNLILEHPGPLTLQEMRLLRRHPAYTYEILSRIARFRDLAEVASSHHERLDGTGYHRGLSGDQLSLPARALAVADIAEALSAERPYRGGLPWSEVLRVLDNDAGSKICAECLAALSALPGETIYPPTHFPPGQPSPREPAAEFSHCTK